MQNTQRKERELDIGALNSSRDVSVLLQDARLPSPGIYAGIFLVSSAVLLFELALTRIFAVLLWSHLAFMVVGTALFGFGLSGVYLALKEKRSELHLGTLALLLPVTMILSYLVVANIPFSLWSTADSSPNLLALAVWYMSLVLPFFCAGLIIARILIAYPKRSSRLYGADLVGAAAGALLLIPVIPNFGGVGTVVFAAIIATIAALFLLNPTMKAPRLMAVALLVLLAVMLPQAERWLPLSFHSAKRRFNMALNKIMATAWSPISRVDVAKHKENVLDLWIDAGTNESSIHAWDGDLANLKPMRWSSIGASYALKHGSAPNVLVIGPSGGKEVLFALSYGARHVDAVELDPSIVELLSRPKFRKYMGDLYFQPPVNFVNDEGRAFLRRQPKNHYDVIQFVNNYTPVAMAAGALNLSETFLLTKEAFGDYLDHLTDDGVLALHRGATLRVAMTALEALREKGVKDPHNHLLIASGEVNYFEGFFLKKSPWSTEEIQKVYEYYKDRPRFTKTILLWTPSDPNRNNIYSELMDLPAEEQAKYFSSLGVNLEPASDDKPFVERFLQFGKHEIDPRLPKEFKERNAEKWRGIVPRGDFPYVVILSESILLASIFLLIPLIGWARGAYRVPGFAGFLTYFSCLGLSFIAIEICLMKRYVLFLGNPVYSITTILVAILLGAGIGSMTAERVGAKNPLKSLALVIPLVAVAIIAETIFAPALFDYFLYLPFAGRVMVATAMLLPLGFFMGMPFPLGLQIINRQTGDQKTRRQMTAWAWGMNGYFTVIGSAGAVFMAVFTGFKAVLLTALGIYMLGLLAILAASRSRTA